MWNCGDLYKSQPRFAGTPTQVSAYLGRYCTKLAQSFLPSNLLVLGRVSRKHVQVNWCGWSDWEEVGWHGDWSQGSGVSNPFLTCVHAIEPDRKNQHDTCIGVFARRLKVIAKCSPWASNLC